MRCVRSARRKRFTHRSRRGAVAAFTVAGLFAAELRRGNATVAVANGVDGYTLELILR
jgi:hypothetical protein